MFLSKLEGHCLINDSRIVPPCHWKGQNCSLSKIFSLYLLTFLEKGEDMGKKNQGCQWGCREQKIPESTARQGSASL